MKAIKILGFPFLILLILSSVIPFQSCDPDDDDNDCDTCPMVRKPNIYIYPTEDIQLTVKIEFPMGGKIVTSIPEYGSAWNISVNSNGIIDHLYTYLFYESIQPDIWQRDEGWIIKMSDLESFFNENMIKYGFEGQEIKDFIDYWIPRLNNFDYYYIYPQNSELIDDVIELSFSKQPDNLLRLFYIIKGFNDSPNDKLREPIIDSQFKREKYFVTEWGVVLN